MKKVVLFLLICSGIYAHSWRVSMDPSHLPDFTSLQLANDAPTVAVGDTIYITGNPNAYTETTINKKLIIIGSGYFFNENHPFGITISIPVKFYQLTFDIGSAGSILTGCEVSSLILKEKNLLIKRNKIDFMSLTEGAQDEIVIQNYFSVTVRQESLLPVLSNTIFKNNLITGLELGDVNNTIVVNNVFIYVPRCHYAIVQNNILQNINSNNIDFQNCDVKNNMCSDGSLNDYPGNYNNVDMGTVFESVDTGSPDGRYKLKSGSPAIGVGINGEDLGMYGGANPYVLSGIPAIPTIYFLSVPAVGTKDKGLNITIKARTNN